MQSRQAPGTALAQPDGAVGTTPGDLLQELRRRAPHPYLDQVARLGRAVRMESLACRPRLRGLITTYFPLSGFTLAKRFRNAYNLMRFLESYRVLYVEGIALTQDGRFLPHAWIAHEGDHFDPTAELGLAFALAEGAGGPGFPAIRDYLALVTLDQAGFWKALHKRGVPWRGDPALEPPYAVRVLHLPEPPGDLIRRGGNGDGPRPAPSRR